MRLDVPATALRAGALLDLGVCARHGELAVAGRTRRFSTPMPALAWMTFPFFFLITLLLVMVTERDVAGPVPECARCVARRKAWRNAVLASVLVTVSSFTVSLLASQLSAFLLGLLGFLVSLVLLLGHAGSGVGGTLDKDRDVVHLDRVAPAFAQLVKQRMAAAPQPDPWVIPLV